MNGRCWPEPTYEEKMRVPPPPPRGGTYTVISKQTDTLPNSVIQCVTGFGLRPILFPIFIKKELNLISVLYCIIHWPDHPILLFADYMHIHYSTAVYSRFRNSK